MSIRSTLLLFFLLIGLIPATALTGLAFFQARNALKQEISHGLEARASAMLEQIDRRLYESMLQIHTWSHLEIMEEVRVGDVDKRLSHLLFDLAKYYQASYLSLQGINAQGFTVASSDPKLIGKSGQPENTWLESQLSFGQTRLYPLHFGALPSEAKILLEVELNDLATKTRLGKFQAMFNWAEIFQILDQTGRRQDSPPLALLFDQQGRIIAASLPLRQRGLLEHGELAQWVNLKASDAVLQDPQARLGFDEVLAGTATSQGHQDFPGFGWTLQVYQPTALAFAPIRQMAIIFMFLLALTSVVAFLLSYWIASWIAGPIMALTELTRRYMREGKPQPPIAGCWVDEIRELAETFSGMTYELEQSRENLVRAAKLGVVGEMAATMAHEVRTPLGIIKSSAQMLEREPVLSDAGREMLGFILSENARLTDLISSLLDCARPRQPLMATHNLHAIVERAISLLGNKAANKNIKITIEFDSAVDQLTCDEEQILQVLLNLIMNALQILPKGGQVVIRSKGLAEGLMLSVDDDGPGISGENLARIFDPFFTSREGGIGLGLTICQQILKAHGGEISACTSPEGGARLQLYFPKTP